MNQVEQKASKRPNKMVEKFHIKECRNNILEFYMGMIRIVLMKAIQTNAITF